VRRDGPLPIAGQLAEQLVAQIRSGRLRAGQRLPPVRVLAGFLRVNRNTVAKVYAALERAGYLLTTPGRGTFVAAGAAPEAASLAPLVDRLLDEAAVRGVDEEALRALIAERAVLRHTAARPRVAFVECNPTDLAYFGRQLTARLRQPLALLTLAELPAAARSVDLVATTMFHVEEVRRLLPRHDVVGLLAMPEMSSLEAVAAIPRRARVVLVCATEEGVRSKERSIRALGIRPLRLQTATLHQPDRLERVLRTADVVVASPKVLERLGGRLPPRARVIPFGSVLGEGAVAVLQERIRAWRPRRVREDAL
jgi:DNA-binding transcriptional regulator YhcF (GntR family)